MFVTKNRMNREMFKMYFFLSFIFQSNGWLNDTFDLRTTPSLVRDRIISLPNSHYSKFNKQVLLDLGYCLLNTNSSYNIDFLDTWETGVRTRNIKKLRSTCGANRLFRFCAHSNITTKQSLFNNYMSDLLQDSIRLCSKIDLETNPINAKQSKPNDQTLNISNVAYERCIPTYTSLNIFILYAVNLLGCCLAHLTYFWSFKFYLNNLQSCVPYERHL